MAATTDEIADESKVIADEIKEIADESNGRSIGSVCDWRG
jgi:hypothetical protein